MELTGDTVPEIYIWLDLYGNVSQRGGARHLIYAKQPNGTYEKVYETALCLSWSVVSFTPTDKEGQPRILIYDDLHCNYRPDSTRIYYEFILTNNGSKEDKQNQ